MCSIWISTHWSSSTQPKANEKVRLQSCPVMVINRCGELNDFYTVLEEFEMKPESEDC